MFFFSDIYFQNVENARVVLFYGQVGSYKTLSAVATARQLLKSGRYERVMCNFPCTFATSPPITDNFDFLDYAYSNTIFIIDESALFITGKADQYNKIFAFPRKINQVFLLASVLPVKQVRDFCHLFVTRDFNYSLFGLPIMSFRSGSWGQRKQPKHWILFYSQYFRQYSSKYRPNSMYPIDQWRDKGVLYDAQSRRIPPQYAQYFFVDAWGQANRRRDLSTQENIIVNQVSPIFDTSNVFSDETQLPELKQKKGFNFIGTEFNVKFFAQAIIVLYLLFIFGSYFMNLGGKTNPITQWNKDQWLMFLSGERVPYIENYNVQAQQPVIPETQPTPNGDCVVMDRKCVPVIQWSKSDE